MIKINAGFTIIELMVTVVIIAILAVMAIPSFGTMLAKYYLNKSSQELITTLTTAKSIAVLERRNVIVEIGLVDVNTLQNNQIPKKLYWAPSGNAFLKSGQTSLTFLPNGMIQASNTDDVMVGDLAFSICDHEIESQYSKTIRLSKIGKIQQIQNGDCS